MSVARVCSGLLPLMSSSPATTESRSDLDGAAAAAEEEGSEEWAVPICHDGHLAVVLYVDMSAAADLRRDVRGTSTFPSTRPDL